MYNPHYIAHISSYFLASARSSSYNFWKVRCFLESKCDRTRLLTHLIFALQASQWKTLDLIDRNRCRYLQNSLEAPISSLKRSRSIPTLSSSSSVYCSSRQGLSELIDIYDYLYNHYHYFFDNLLISSSMIFEFLAICRCCRLIYTWSKATIFW